DLKSRQPPAISVHPAAVLCAVPRARGLPPHPGAAMIYAAWTSKLAHLNPSIIMARFRTASRLLASLLCFAAAAIPRLAAGQNLRDRIGDLFIFGPGQQPLFLAGSGDPNNPASIQAHGLHFIPASNAENGAL